MEDLEKKLKIMYTFTCDLTPKYNTNVIAECISAPRFLIMIINWGQKIYHRVKEQHKKS